MQPLHHCGHRRVGRSRSGRVRPARPDTHPAPSHAFGATPVRISTGDVQLSGDARLTVTARSIGVLAGSVGSSGTATFQHVNPFPSTGQVSSRGAPPGAGPDCVVSVGSVGVGSVEGGWVVETSVSTGTVVETDATLSAVESELEQAAPSEHAAISTGPMSRVCVVPTTHGSFPQWLRVIGFG